MMIGALTRAGYDVIPAHFSSPIPDLRHLPEWPWALDHDPPGLDLRERDQLALLDELQAQSGAEYGALPEVAAAAGADALYLDNPFFGRVDASIAFAMVRRLSPALVVEVGSGFSTLVMVRALALNRGEGRPGAIVSIDPFPREPVRALAAQETLTLVETPVERAGTDLAARLRAGDILFIDSSHVLRTGNDVHLLFQEVLPRLSPGVVVHVHDIFWPHDYPREWVTRDRVYHSEQYLLQAFLLGNRNFEVLLANRWLQVRHPDRVRRAIPAWDGDTVTGSSVWFRRVTEP
ncbi:MAG: class I SAM-dependent methyltransferase [Candidatus Dormibacteria bacterium]